MDYNRAALKRNVRQAMRSQRPHPMLITLLFMIIVNVGSQFISQILGFASGANDLSSLYYQAVLDYGDPVYAVQYVLLSFSPQRLALALFAGVFVAGVITSLWSGLMRTGYAGFCLDMVRGARPQTEALFNIFPKWAGVVFTQFLAGLFRSLWALLLGAGFGVVVFIAALLFARLEVLLVLVLLISYFACFLGLVWITLRYAMVDYLIADRDLTGMDAIRESKRLMRGNTVRLLTLRLSFIGWYLLEAAVVLAAVIAAMIAVGKIAPEADNFPGISTAMVGGLLIFIPLALVATVGIVILNLWLTPYITGAEALFYEWARGEDITSSRGFGPPGGWDPPRHFDYTQTSGPSSGTGIGGGTPPRPPRDDPWD